MTLCYEEATAQITAPGERYETEEIVVGVSPTGRSRGAAAALRDLADLTRGYGDTTFLVYEDER